MALALNDKVLIDTFANNEGAMRRAKQAIMVVLGVAVLALTAKMQFFIPGNPVPVTLTTFAVLTIGAGYGARLGALTVAGYLALGLMGMDVFAGSSAENAGLVYMMGGTGGYLVGYMLAALALGVAARKGWDRNVVTMGLAMLVGSALVYIPGLLWLHQFASGWEQTLAWGITPFLIGDALKLALAALIVPALWKLIGNARS
ncbi:biotin transport system substrate-specific component [Loktanella ponticola]|uniref:Biotin transporter n=1 Tax=Yoonia ponticola TaxID=1524255 RepID=A0A7W9BK98_9RHOB|nr:biotin transporter BioY [Yoonia ponticola]MBB5722097.1 biotin transport system substrate-specific component [Yoonia ponticola]